MSARYLGQSHFTVILNQLVTISYVFVLNRLFWRSTGFIIFSAYMTCAEFSKTITNDCFACRGVRITVIKLLFYNTSLSFHQKMCSNDTGISFYPVFSQMSKLVSNIIIAVFHERVVLQL